MGNVRKFGDLNESPDLEGPNKRLKTSTAPPLSCATGTTSLTFPLFPAFPAEIRARIWEAAIVARIVRCNRTNDEEIFKAPSKSLPLFSVCRESREAAFLYGGYLLLGADPYVYFSPEKDYLLFDVGWKPLRPRPQSHVHPDRHAAPDDCDFFETLNAVNPGLLSLKNIMVHPNFSDERMMPSVQIARFALLEKVLIASDEKSTGSRSGDMFANVHDIKMYYVAAMKRNAETKMPRIAVGCLGWTGTDRWSLHHGSQDNRQLVAEFQDYAAMKEHQRLLREEEMRFTKERFASRKPSWMVKLRLAQEALESGHRVSSASVSQDSAAASKPVPSAPSPVIPKGPPNYDDAVSSDIEMQDVPTDTVVSDTSEI